MSDLGQLLAATETAVERARAGEAPTPGALAATMRRVRRRRVVRHSAESMAGVAAVGVLGATAWLGTHRADPPAPAATTTPTASPTPTATPTPEPVAPATSAVHVGTPLPVAAGLVESSTAGWMLVADSQSRTGVDPEDATPDDYRTVVMLVSPAGERHPVLEVVSDRIMVGWFWWTAGQPMVLATSTDYSAAQPQDLVGLLDLRTGDLTPWLDLPTSAMWIGGTRAGTTVWAAPQWDPADIPPGAVPMPRNVLGPQMRMGKEFAGTPFRLLVRDADGTQHDLGPIDDSRYVTSLSPDGAWVSATGPDGALQLVDLRSGTRTTVSSVPTDRACTVAGWSGPHELLLSCGVPAELLALDATATSPAPRVVGTSEHTVVDATPVGDGRVAVELSTQEAPCDGGGDPAVLADGVVSPLTGQWGPWDHSYGFQVGGGTVVADLNGCYVGHGKAGRQRTISTDLTTGAVTELASLEGEVTDDGWDRSMYGWLVGQ